MSKSIALVCALVSATFVAACGTPQQDEVVYVQPAPIVAEPVYNKY